MIYAPYIFPFAQSTPESQRHGGAAVGGLPAAHVALEDVDGGAVARRRPGSGGESTVENPRWRIPELSGSMEKNG